MQIEDLKSIALHYLKTWFIVDFIATFPFFLVVKLFTMKVRDGNATTLAKVSAFGKLYRMMRFVRLGRLVKILKNSKKGHRSMSSVLSINAGTERLLFFIGFIFLFTHIMTCLWILTA